jgi:hypothetical protein
MEKNTVKPMRMEFDLMFERVLAATDFSKHSDQIIQHGSYSGILLGQKMFVLWSRPAMLTYFIKNFKNKNSVIFLI